MNKIIPFIIAVHHFDIHFKQNYRYGLFNYATEQTGGYVNFDYFRKADKITK